YRKISGRATRSEYWYLVMFFFMILFLTGFVDTILGTYFISAIFFLAMLPPLISASIRRMHDTNKSGAWLLIVLIPVIGLMAVLIVLAGKRSIGANIYGINPE